MRRHIAAATIGNALEFYDFLTYAFFSIQIGHAETAGNVLSIPAMWLGGWLSDRHGRRPINVWGNLSFLLIIYPAFLLVVDTRSEFALIAAMTVLSAVFSFNAGSFYAGLAESLPKTIRGSGSGTVYSLSIAAFGGTSQLAITWLIHLTGSAMAPAWYLTGATAIGQIAYMLVRESAPVRVSTVRAALTPAALPA